MIFSEVQTISFPEGLEDTPFNIQKKKKENYLAFGFDKYARSFGAVLGVNIVFRS